MKHIFKAFMCILIVSFSVSSCSKSNDTSTSTPTISKTQLLTSSDWGIAGIQHKAVAASVWTDDYASMKACEKDNKVVFKATGAYETNEGATKCSSNDPQILETGTWKLTQSETVLVVQATNGTQIFNATIETLTSSSLIFSFTQVDATSGVTYQYKYSFSH